MRVRLFVLAAVLLPLSSVAQAQGLGTQHEQYGMDEKATPKEKACRTEALAATRRHAGQEGGAGRNIGAAENVFKANWDQCMARP
jgi:hypothetical protein